jgi:hypothetical protein
MRRIVVRYGFVVVDLILSISGHSMIILGVLVEITLHVLHFKYVVVSRELRDDV